MSSHLSAKIQPPIDNDLLLRDAEHIFSEIVNVGFVTPFCFWGSSIGLVEIGHSVDFGEVEIEAQPPWITTEAGVYAFASTGGSHGIEYAVAASLMIAVAMKYNSDIIDDAVRWVRFPGPPRNYYGCPASVFQQAVTNTERFSDLETAAGAFYKRLPVLLTEFEEKD